MEDFMAKINATVVGISMSCVACGAEIERGDVTDEHVEVDMNESQHSDMIILKDDPCTNCGCNTFESVVGYVDISFT